ncbi:hypothetical protein ACIQTZ_08175 [Paenarthrobacter sp. NPDC090520]|uniref:hypothetical protein n=1 Tax=Paenarthrobacter sp. NPDC090520 TaxID=3364382 RepID=UPI00380EDC63
MGFIVVQNKSAHAFEEAGIRVVSGEVDGFSGLNPLSCRLFDEPRVVASLFPEGTAGAKVPIGECKTELQGIRRELGLALWQKLDGRI